MNSLRRFYAFVLILLFSTSALAQTFSQQEDFAPAGSWDWSAQLRAQVNFIVEQKPSSVRGRPYTDWGSLRFENQLRSQSDPYVVVISGHVGPKRSTSDQEPVFGWDQLKLMWTGGPDVSLGLLQDPVVDFAWGSFWGSDYGADFETGLSKWKLIPRSDLGISLASLLGTGILHWQVTNGEGWPEPEIGVRKDFQVSWEQRSLWSESSAGYQLFYRRGGYDKLSEDNNIKERAGAQAFYQTQLITLGGTLALTNDSVDGINGQFGEGVNLAAKGGQVTKGSLAELWLGTKWGEAPKQWRAFIRGAQLKADQDDTDKQILQTALGIARTLGTSGMNLALTFQSTNFGHNYALLAEDRSRWMLSWSWGLRKNP